jgi:hypothetical protein
MPMIRWLDRIGTRRESYMKVFLSWSGQLSKRVAEELHRWLPNVIQALEPWLSSEDIAKGAQWSSQVTAELEASKAGIICVTPSNKHAPWLNFEAGAISNQVKPTKMVCTFLVGMKTTDLDGPLAQFQATVPSGADVRRLVGTLNQGLGKTALPEKKLDVAFMRWWPELESALEAIGSVEPPAGQKRTDREIAEETLDLVRALARRPFTPRPLSSSYLVPFVGEAQTREWREAASALGGVPPASFSFADAFRAAMPTTVDDPEQSDEGQSRVE